MAKRSKRQQKTAASVKRYRKLYAAAKSKGVVKGDKDARTFQPTRYMKTRLNKLEPFLGKEYVAVKAPKELRDLWKDAPSSIVPKTANRKLLIKREPGVKINIKGLPGGGKGDNRRSYLSLKRKLAAGEFERIPLPINAHSLNQFKEWIENNRYYNDILKHRDELFNFKIWGNPSLNNFGDIEALIEELEKYDNYDHPDEDDLNWGDSPRFFDHFELFRSYKDWKWPRDTDKFKREKSNIRRAKRRQRALERSGPEGSPGREAYLERQREFRAVRRQMQPGYASEKKQKRSKYASMTAAEKAAYLAKKRADMRRLRASKKAD